MKPAFAIFTFLTLAAFSGFGSENVKVLIYRGPGACEGCPEAISTLLQTQGLRIQYVGPGELTRENFSSSVMYVQPGGSDRLMDTLEKLQPQEIQELRRFVFSGGAYLGVCAGAYLAARETQDEGKFIRGFDLLPFRATDEKTNVSPQSVEIIWGRSGSPPERRQVYFQDGPNLDWESVPGASLWASYSDSHHGAAFMAPAGLGRVGLIGPHLEADESWFIEDHLQTPALLSMDLFIKFVNSLLNEKTNSLESPTK